MQVRNVEENANKSISDPLGHPLPPCIVMERGESLDIWAERAKPDRSMAFTVRPSHVSLRTTMRLSSCVSVVDW